MIFVLVRVFVTLEITGFSCVVNASSSSKLILVLVRVFATLEITGFSFVVNASSKLILDLTNFFLIKDFSDISNMSSFCSCNSNNSSSVIAQGLTCDLYLNKEFDLIGCDSLSKLIIDLP